MSLPSVVAAGCIRGGPDGRTGAGRCLRIRGGLGCGGLGRRRWRGRRVEDDAWLQNRELPDHGSARTGTCVSRRRRPGAMTMTEETRAKE